MCFVNIQSSLHVNVVFSVCVHMGNAVYIIFIKWNSISSLDTWYHFRFNISCGVAVKVRKIPGIFLQGGEGGQKKFLEGRANFQGHPHFLRHLHF